MNKKKFFKGITAAACLIAVAGSGTLIAKKNFNTEPSYETNEFLDLNSFCIKVNASELEPGKEISTTTKGERNNSFNISEGDDNIWTCVTFVPLKIEGEN